MILFFTHICMMNIMYRHIMHRGKNTSVVCRGHMRTKHVRTHRKKRTTRTRHP